MKFLGQRWEYRVGNSTELVDNAFSWSLWAQERLIVNDETAHHSSGWLRFGRKFDEPWLTMVGEETLRVVMTSRAASIVCRVQLGDSSIDPHACYVTKWTGKAHSWPESNAWRSVETGEAIRFDQA